jgi:predicted nucleic-acid-binding protein
MNDHDTLLASLDVDQAWIVDWATDGVLAIERYLAKHAAFADFLRARDDLDWSDGDGCSDA